MTRREFLIAVPAAAAPAAGEIGFGYGTYGAKTLTTDAALRLIAETGYDGVELALMPGWPTEPKLLDAARRKQLRAQLRERRLALPSLLEVLPLLGGAGKRQENLERLKRAIELGRDLSPGHPPVVETILGGKTAAWDQTKAQMVEELREWARVGESTKTVICFKPHAAHAVHNPERALWLVKQVGSPSIRVIYDYSHLWLEGSKLADSLKQLLPVSPFIHVKDAAGTPEKHEYLLPGDGQTDYVEYFRLLKEYGYRGFVVVEVSAMVHNKAGFDPVATAKLCYSRLAPAIEKAGLKRRKTPA